MSTRHRRPARPGATRTRQAALAVLCAAFVGAVPAPAQAQTVSDPDPAGDVVMATYTEDEEALVAVPERKQNDVTATTLRHDARRVAIRVEYAELKKTGYQVLSIDMVTNENVHRHLVVQAYQRHWAGEASMYGGHYREVDCRIKHSIDYDANVMKVSFPRRCADDPRWVKFRVGAFSEVGDAFYADDALRDRPLTFDDRRLASSDKVRRETAS